ncbi:MAG: hypothetical protein JXR19_10535 [Bacteroidia bacterium]
MPNRRKLIDESFMSGGFGIGQEYWYGVNLSFIQQFPLTTQTYFKRHYGFRPVALYTGLDINFFGHFAFWAGAGINVGIALGPLTIDNSLSTWGIIGPDRKSFSQKLYNPKIGIHIGRVWLKAGPSFLLSDERWSEDQLKLGKYNMNISVSVLGDRSGY